MKRERKSEPDNGISSELEDFQANFPSHFARQLREERLPRLIRGSRGSNFVYPLILWIIVYNQLFYESLNGLDLESTGRRWSCLSECNMDKKNSSDRVIFLAV